MDMVNAGIVVVILIVWFVLQGKVPMTPYDIYEKWKSDLSYVPPEATDVALGKTRWAIKRVEEIFDDHGPRTEAGSEAVEVLQKLRKHEAEIRLRR